MPVPTMPSRPLFDGIAIPSCTGIRVDGTTIRAINARGVDRKSLPITTSMGEHNIFFPHLCNHGGGIWSNGCTSNALGPSKSNRQLGKGVDGTLVHQIGNDNAIVFPPSDNYGEGIFANGGTSDAVGPSDCPCQTSMRDSLSMGCRYELLLCQTLQFGVCSGGCACLSSLSLLQQGEVRVVGTRTHFSWGANANTAGAITLASRGTELDELGAYAALSDELFLPTPHPESSLWGAGNVSDSSTYNAIGPSASP
jgi:hypothetical protein